MEWVKTTAKTLPEAIDLALDNLGVDESEAEIVILEEPRTGLFGRTRGTARVEARVKPKPIRPKNERNRNRRSRSDEGGRDRSRNRNRNRNRDRGRSDGDRTPATTSGDESTGAEVAARDSGGAPSSGGGRSGNRGDGNGGGRNRSRNRNRNRNRDQGRGDGGGAGGRRANGAERANDGRGRQSAGRGGTTSAPADGSGDQSVEASGGATVEDVATHLRTFLTELNEAFGFDSGVTIDDSEEGTLIGRIDGRHGLLVGPKGRTLDAVQELARISCQRTVPSNVRIKIDVGGYRDQRAAALADFANQAADRAIENGVEVALEPMSPADRKSVHDALNGDDRVETRSVGSEPRRRVVVVPLDVEANGSGPADGSNGGSDADGDDLDVEVSAHAEAAADAVRAAEDGADTDADELAGDD